MLISQLFVIDQLIHCGRTVIWQRTTNVSLLEPELEDREARHGSSSHREGHIPCIHSAVEFVVNS